MSRAQLSTSSVTFRWLSVNQLFPLRLVTPTPAPTAIGQMGPSSSVLWKSPPLPLSLTVSSFLKVLCIYVWLCSLRHFVVCMHYCGFSLVEASRGCPLVAGLGFSLQWLLSLRNTSPLVCRLRQLRHAGSVVAEPGVLEHRLCGPRA